MAKLSDRQKINLKAKWDTGEYSKLQLAKAYKISDVMVGKIVGKQEPKNSHIVEAGVMLEKAKKFEKSSSEVSAINQAVSERLKKDYSDDNNRIKVYDLTADILNGVSKLIKGGKAHKVMTESMGEAGSSATPIEYPLQAEHYEKAMNTVDKASITLKVNERHAPKIDINNTNAQQNNDKVIKIEYS